MAIGALMTELGDRHTGEPIPEDLLREVIESPDKEQLVAELDGKIVGSAVLNYMVTGTTRRVYLDNFVCSSEVQGRGVGFAMWQAIGEYCLTKNTTSLEFTSGHDREAAHAFYERQGAVIKDTAHFKKIFQ